MTRLGRRTCDVAVGRVLRLLGAGTNLIRPAVRDGSRKSNASTCSRRQAGSLYALWRVHRFKLRRTGEVAASQIIMAYHALPCVYPQLNRAARLTIHMCGPFDFVLRLIRSVRRCQHPAKETHLTRSY